MVILRSTNRFLTKVEIDYDLSQLGYDSSTLKSVLKKYGHSAKNLEWKKDVMDEFRSKLEAERQDLDDLFAIHLETSRIAYEQKLKLEMSKQLFVIKERYFNFEFKCSRLKGLVKILNKKTQDLINSVNRAVSY
jgi:hypothetical protein